MFIPVFKERVKVVRIDYDWSGRSVPIDRRYTDYADGGSREVIGLNYVPTVSLRAFTKDTTLARARQLAMS
jgi:hypothetical protein